jgi:hypothetical protein
VSLGDGTMLEELLDIIYEVDTIPELPTLDEGEE